MRLSYSRDPSVTLAARIMAVSSLAYGCFPSPAHADPVNGSAGIYLSVTLDKKGDDAVGYGLEGEFLDLLSGGADCMTTPRRFGLGGLVQIGGIGGSTFRVVGALQGGSELTNLGSTYAIGRDTHFFLHSGVLGELGIAGHVGKDPGIGLHTGLDFQVPFFLNLFARAEWVLNEYSVGIGLRGPGPFEKVPLLLCTTGRPLRDASGASVSPPPLERTGARARRRTSRHGRSADLLSAQWSEAARGEAASVPAFLALAGDLARAGAPVALAHRALDAARDEILHAAMCANLASKWSGERLLPVLPLPSQRRARPRDEELVRLATESWLDGCLNEGTAAVWARAGVEGAEDADARCVQSTIARDESRHAGLGWDVLQWAIRAGGPVVADAVRDLRDATPSEPPAVSRTLKAHGWPSSAEMVKIACTHTRAAAARLDRVLASA